MGNMIKASEEPVVRWDTFLANIENRFYNSLQQTEEASMELLIDSNYDYDKVMRAFTGIKGQIANLIQKIDKTWKNQVRHQRPCK